MQKHMKIPPVQVHNFTKCGVIPTSEHTIRVTNINKAKNGLLDRGLKVLEQLDDIEHTRIQALKQARREKQEEIDKIFDRLEQGLMIQTSEVRRLVSEFTCTIEEQAKQDLQSSDCGEFLQSLDVNDLVRQ
jgi:lipopolysaccharide biosynthesis regulator YciM